ncbi:hypothetical protein JYB62_00575 [Algoriphagus lutimaris]|uniref:glutamate-cysteine ligase family protein n=1 Tax=Algoriphagus lutimaris TaxID=613197 RepID=UPI00196AE745|nr:glutamate-cysteine ligase family protein [Algoriphagus lutimaris]MBN3518479.1 hypothetical protein [Algoriphagus lutimaris]
MEFTNLNQDICRKFVEDELFSPKLQKNPSKPGLIGLEIESFPYRIDQKTIVPVPLYEGVDSLAGAIEKTAKSTSQESVFYSLPEHQKRFLDKVILSHGDIIQFEPGGQLEVATAPCNSFDQIQTQLGSTWAFLNDISQNEEIRFASYGTNPWLNENQIGLQLPKPRYQALQQYLNGISLSGKQMMLLTCSIHINLDLGESKETRRKRIIASNLIAPFLTAIFSHSPIQAVKLTSHKSHRSFLWQNLDHQRTGFPLDFKKNQDLDSLIDSYLDFGLKAPLIHIHRLGAKPLPKGFSFSDWLQNPVSGISPTIDDLRNHFTLLFPEVRLKGFLELRSCDALPEKWQLVPMAFCCGLLYHDQSIDAVLELTEEILPDLKQFWNKASFGLEDEALFNYALKLFELAISGFTSLPSEFRGQEQLNLLLEYFEQYTSQQISPADDLIREFQINNSLII